MIELRSGVSRTLRPNAACNYESLTWSAHHGLIAVQPCDHDSVHTVVTIEPRTGAMHVIAEAGDWEPRPQLSLDGKALYFQANIAGSKPSFYRLRLGRGAKPELVFALPAGADEGAIAVSGEWLATRVQNRVGVRLAKFGPDGVTPRDAKSFVSSPSVSPWAMLERVLGT